MLSVQVPDGVEYNYGRLIIEGANGGAYTYNNFNFKPGLFIVKFSEDPADKKAYNYGRGSISTNTTAVIPSGVEGPKVRKCIALFLENRRILRHKGKSEVSISIRIKQFK